MLDERTNGQPKPMTHATAVVADTEENSYNFEMVFK